MIPASIRSARSVRRRLRPFVERAGATPGADRYRKHFPATAHLWLLLVHVLDGAESLRQTHSRLAALPGFFRRIGLPKGISRSQLARSTTSRDPACVERFFLDLVAHTRQRAQRNPLWQRLRTVQAVDSTFLHLSARLCPWAVHGGHAAGVRMHVGMDLAGSIPATIHLTGSESHDAGAFDQRDLAPLHGWTLLMDLGYYGHRRFARLIAAGVDFLCPLHGQASTHVEETFPVDPTPTDAGDVIVRDARITLGSPNNRSGAVVPNVRLITSRNATGVERQFVTSRFDLTAGEVATLYRKRWQIELLFRWLKLQLRLVHPLGRSREAVWVSVLIAAIVAIVLSLIEPDRPRDQSHVQWLSGVAAALETLLRGSG